MKVGIANDHSGVEMKNEMKAYLESKGFEVINYGTDSTESTDYPIWGEKLANAVIAGEVEYGVGICGTGLGIGLALGSTTYVLLNGYKRFFLAAFGDAV